MASHVVVIDSSFRRVTIKVTPGKYLTDVLEEACAKWGYKSSNYGLKHNNKPLDISRTFRQTNLSSGAKLELIVASRSPSVVSVALQLPQTSTGPGTRMVDKVPSDTSLWLILRKFESSGETNLNFTARGVTQMDGGASGAGRIFYEMPVLNIMGRELATFGDLQKTLAQLGFNGGSTLIRLEFKKTEQPLEEAIAEIGQYFKEEEALQAPANGESSDAGPKEVAIARLPSAESTASEDVTMSESTSADPTPYPESVTDAPLAAGVTPSKRPGPGTEDHLLGPDQRPISVFAPPSHDTPRAALAPYNEDDFEPTIAHAKLHQSRLLNNTINQRLPSDAEVERQEEEKATKLASMKVVSIKIRFPDTRVALQDFTSEHTCAYLYNYVTQLIVAEDQPFKLVWTGRGPQTVPRDEKKRLIKDLGFEGGILVNFVWEDEASDDARKGPALKPQYIEKEKEISVPELPVAPKQDDEKPADGKGKGKEKESDGRGGGEKKMPRWLKGLSKK